MPLLRLQASKAALTLYGRELARQLAETQVSVLAADPGVTGETSLFRYGFMPATTAPVPKSV